MFTHKNVLSCTSTNERSLNGCAAGRYYYEVTVRDEGLCRVGVSTPAARLDLGTDRFGFGFGGTGKKSNNRQFDDYGEVYAELFLYTRTHTRTARLQRVWHYSAGPAPRITLEPTHDQYVTQCYVRVNLRVHCTDVRQRRRDRLPRRPRRQDYLLL